MHASILNMLNMSRQRIVVDVSRRYREALRGQVVDRSRLHILNRKRNRPEIVIQAEFVELGSETPHGPLIRCLEIPWRALIAEIERNDQFLFEFSRHPRKFEEFIAAAYDRAGWPEVVLTPRSGDRGRDVIAVKPGFCSVRILEQTKAYSPRHVVTHDDVRAALALSLTDSNSSKVALTTTSTFAPGVFQDADLMRHVPFRLELRDGVGLREWLSEIDSVTALKNGSRDTQASDR